MISFLKKKNHNKNIHKLGRQRRQSETTTRTHNSNKQQSKKMSAKIATQFLSNISEAIILAICATYYNLLRSHIDALCKKFGIDNEEAYEFLEMNDTEDFTKKLKDELVISKEEDAENENNQEEATKEKEKKKRVYKKKTTTTAVMKNEQQQAEPLPEGDASDPVPKRKGRKPKKADTVAETKEETIVGIVSDEHEQQEEKEPMEQPKRRGRPPKNAGSEPAPRQRKTKETNPTTGATKRGPGRPKKDTPIVVLAEDIFDVPLSAIGMKDRDHNTLKLESDDEEDKGYESFLSEGF